MKTARFWFRIVPALVTVLWITGCDSVNVTRQTRGSGSLNRDAPETVAFRPGKVTKLQRDDERQLDDGSDAADPTQTRGSRLRRQRDRDPGTEVAQIDDESYPPRSEPDGRTPPTAADLPRAGQGGGSHPASWMPDGTCYYCSGRGQKFVGTDFGTCPHCDGRGRR